MARAYKCRGCGIIRSEKWVERCPGCNGFFNILDTSIDGPGEPAPAIEGQRMGLNDVAAANLERISTGLLGLDKILGHDNLSGISGIAAAAGHIIQIYGEPGSGKSTLLLQACHGITKQRYDLLYVAGEESLEQIKSRADRIGKFNSKMEVIRETQLDDVLDALEEFGPKVAVVDSINTIAVDEYTTGSIPAISIAARELTLWAKRQGAGLFLVVQINKGGDFSGPKAMEHLIDTSLFLSGRHHLPRVLSCTTKNRFSHTPIYAHFQMTDAGFVEVEPEDDPPEEEPQVMPDPLPDNVTPIKPKN